MAKRVITILASDLSDRESEDVTTVEFGWEGSDLEIDLTAEEREDFETAMAPYVSKARRKRAEARGTRSKAASSTASGRSTEELADIRKWASENGLKTSDRGRIAKEILEAYDAR